MSHSHLDAEQVEEVAAHLADRHGLRPWLDRWTLIPGEPWQRPMADGLERAATCAVFMGDQTPSGWFKSEIEAALDRQTRDLGFRVIPVLLPGIDDSAALALRGSFLHLNTWVEFRSGCDDERALHLLVCGVRGQAPGPGPRRAASETMRQLSEQLRTLMELREKNLISETVHAEFQIRILEKHLAT